jgi:hypothetical protein
MSWTLEYGGLEKSFATWGFDAEHATGEFANMALDTFSLAVPGAHIEDDPAFTFESQVIIRRNRTVAGSTFSGGAIEFQGKRLLHVLEGRPEFEGIFYQFAGPWYDLDQTPYLQDIKVYTGDPDNLADFWQTEVILFQSLDAMQSGSVVMITNGAQIRLILQSCLDQCAANSLAAPFQIGSIDPAVLQPSYQVRDLKCSEAIQICMRASPDCKVWADYTTTPPTINVTRRTNCTAVTLAIGDGVSHESIKLTPRYDLQARSVTLFFKQTNSINGSNWVVTTYQQADASGSSEGIGAPPHPVGGTRGVVQTIDMQGFKESTASGHLDCMAVANTATFWRKFVPEMDSQRIRVPNTGGATKGFSVLDSMTAVDPNTGATISLSSYPNVLADGTGIAPWMTLSGGAQINGVLALLKVHVAYEQFDADTGGNAVQIWPRKELSARVTLTNGITGNYSSTLSSEAAEPIPTGLAPNIFSALRALQYHGTIEIIEPECSGSVGMGNVLNLSGGRSEWEAMNELIQEVHKHYGTGKTSVSIGPAAHLGAAALTQIFMVNRLRRTWNNPLTQATGKSSSGASIALGKNAPKENTNSGVPEISYRTELGPIGGDGGRWLIIKNVIGGSGGTIGANSQPGIFMCRYLANGALDTTVPQIRIDASDLTVPTGQTALIAKWQSFLDSLGHTHYVLATAPVAGGGAIFEANITDIQSDTWTCVKTSGGDSFTVAKPRSIRGSVTSLTVKDWQPDGSSVDREINLTYDSTFRKCTAVPADGQTAGESYILTPDIVVAATIILVSQCESGIEDVTYLDITPRQWSQVPVDPLP